MERTHFNQDHNAFRSSVQTFLARHVVPHYNKWQDNRCVDRAAWADAGAHGMLGLAVPSELGGQGVSDFRFRQVVQEEVNRVAATGFGVGLAVHEDIVTHYIATFGAEDQRRRWLPRMADGTCIGAIAMTEPAAGSDLRGIRTRARRVDDGWVLSGQKTFISNGINADLVVVAARTDPDKGSNGMSLFVVERGMSGFARGEALHKLGLHAQDTVEMSFDDVFVPQENLLGSVGDGFGQMMQLLPLERLSLACGAAAATAAAFEWAAEYAFQRKAFGGPIGDLQHTRFTLAEISTIVDVTQTFVDEAVLAHNAGRLSAVAAAKVKLWASEQQKIVVDRCLQIFGGYGYMAEYSIATAYVDARIQTIYGGTSEIMKEIIGRDIAQRFGR